MNEPYCPVTFRTLWRGGALLIALGLLTSATARDRDFRNRVHGPADFLKESLPQSSEFTRLLMAARRELEQGTGDSAFPALLSVFSQQYDHFTVVHDGRPSASTYQLALDMLHQSPPATRQAWQQTVEPLAAKALRDAAGNADELVLVARHYPLTPSGTTAGHLAAGIAFSRGERVLADALRSQMPGPLASPIRSGAAPQPRNLMAGRGGPLPAELSVPLPETLWQWTVPFWQTPQATAFANLARTFHRSILHRNSWLPVISGDTLYVRTPFHVVAFDKHHGTVQWSIRTDTFQQPGPELVLPDDAPQQLDESRLLRQDTLGNLTVNDRYLFFIDHFQLLKSPADFQFGNRFGRRTVISRQPLRRAQGQRLVAVELSSPPRIAWTSGGPDWDYQVVLDGFDQRHRPQSAADARTRLAAAELSLTPDMPTDLTDTKNHRFCGVPVTLGQILFAVSYDGSAYWLNCYSQTSGKVRWRRPLLHDAANSPRIRGMVLTPETDDAEASLCGISGDVVVCALGNGVAMGASVTDGRLLWATNLRKQVEIERNPRLQSLLSAALQASPGIRSQPLIRDGRLYWASAYADKVHCVDTQSGAILWESDRVSEQPGRLEGSRDSYVLEATPTAVILVGERHIRALARDDGRPLWVTPIGEQTGRGFANGRVAVVPQVDGRLCQIDLETGRRVVLADAVAGTAAQYVGSVVADGDTVAFSTPVSVTMAPAATSQRAGSSLLQRARLRLLHGESREALGMLDQSADPAARSLLIDSLFAIGMEHNQGQLTPAEALQWLDRLPLSPTEQIRRNLLADDQRPVPRAAVQQWPTAVPLDQDWRVRWDVALLARESLPGDLVHRFPEDMQATLAREWAILQPGRVGDVRQQLAYADDLVSEHRYAAAELFLLSARSDTPEESAVSALDERIRQLRARFVDSPPAAAPPAPQRVELEETLQLSTGPGIRRIRDQLRTIIETPPWYPHRLYLTARSVVGARLDLGVEVSRLELPVTVETASRVEAFDSPSIIPVYGSDRVGVISLLHPDGPQLLWWKTIDRDAYEDATLEPGPFGSRFVTMAMGGRLLCLHALTGELLWERHTTDDVVTHLALRQLPRLAGGQKSLIRYGRHVQSYEQFRTLDGAPLTTRRVPVSRGQIPLHDAESILFQQDKSLVLHQTLDGRNLLADRDPIRLAGTGQAQPLSNHRIITLNEDLELIVLNTQTGDVQLRSPLAQLVSLDRIVGLKAFERDGLLMVLLKDWDNARTGRSASSRMGELRLDSGLLLAIDPSTGDIRWHLKTAACVAPRIHGAPSGLFVTWAWKNPDNYLSQQLWQRNQLGTRLGSLKNPSRTLTVSVYSMETGRKLAESEKLSPAEPLRCVHDPLAREVLLESESSHVRLKYQ